jgi:hypothetical protein
MLETHPGMDFEANRSEDGRQTIPQDLGEYARAATGPTSWAARPDAGGEAASDWLLGIWPSDVPRAAVGSAEQRALLADDREALVVSLLDGRSSVGVVLEASGLPGAEALEILCELCARGIVALDRSGRSRLPRARGDRGVARSS